VGECHSNCVGIDNRPQNCGIVLKKAGRYCRTMIARVFAPAEARSAGTPMLLAIGRRECFASLRPGETNRRCIGNSAAAVSRFARPEMIRPADYARPAILGVFELRLLGPRSRD